MGLSGKQKAALFEHLRQTGKMNPTKLNHTGNLTAPQPPTAMHAANPAKMIAPIVPPVPPNPPLPPGMSPRSGGINQNYIGQPGPQRFKKIKGMFGI